MVGLWVVPAVCVCKAMNEVLLRCTSALSYMLLPDPHACSWPNAAFDLCGICCGAFLMPFWEFFGATLIGKGVVKVSGQAMFFVALFRCVCTQQQRVLLWDVCYAQHHWRAAVAVSTIPEVVLLYVVAPALAAAALYCRQLAGAAGCKQSSWWHAKRSTLPPLSLPSAHILCLCVLLRRVALHRIASRSAGRRAELPCCR